MAIFNSYVSLPEGTSSVFCFETSAASDHHVLTFFCTQAALDVEREKMERYLEPRHFVVAWTVAFPESCFGGVKCPSRDCWFSWLTVKWTNQTLLLVRYVTNGPDLWLGVSAPSKEDERKRWRLSVGKLWWEESNLMARLLDFCSTRMKNDAVMAILGDNFFPSEFFLSIFLKLLSLFNNSYWCLFLLLSLYVIVTVILLFHHHHHRHHHHQQQHQQKFSEEDSPLWLHLRVAAGHGDELNKYKTEACNPGNRRLVSGVSLWDDEEWGILYFVSGLFIYFKTWDETRRLLCGNLLLGACYTHMYIYIQYIYIYVSMIMHTCTHILTYTYTHNIHIYYIHIYICIHMYICTYVHIYIYTHIYIYIYIYTYIYIHIHIYIYVYINIYT